jgi:hypothetical protein
VPEIAIFRFARLLGVSRRIVFEVKLFQGDGGNLISQPRGEKMRWLSLDADVASVKADMVENPKKWFNAATAVFLMRELVPCIFKLIPG